MNLIRKIASCGDRRARRILANVAGRRSRIVAVIDAPDGPIYVGPSFDVPSYGSNIR